MNPNRLRIQKLIPHDPINLSSTLNLLKPSLYPPRDAQSGPRRKLTRGPRPDPPGRNRHDERPLSQDTVIYSSPFKFLLELHYFVLQFKFYYFFIIFKCFMATIYAFLPLWLLNNARGNVCALTSCCIVNMSIRTLLSDKCNSSCMLQHG